MPTPSGDALQSSVMQRGSVMDYQQTLSPLHPFQTPPARNFVGHNTPWISQGPFRGPWMASPQTSAPDASTRLPNTEAIKLTPVKELSVPHSSGIKHPVVHSGVPTSTSLLDPKKVTASPGKNSTDPKSRKRRKNPDLNKTRMKIQLAASLSRSAGPSKRHSSTTTAQIRRDNARL